MLMRLLSGGERSWDAGSAVTKIRIKGKAGENGKWLTKTKLRCGSDCDCGWCCRLLLLMFLLLLLLLWLLLLRRVAAAATAAATAAAVVKRSLGFAAAFLPFFAATTTTTTESTCIVAAAVRRRRGAVSASLFASQPAFSALHCTFPSPSWMQFFTVFSVDCHASMEFQFEFEFEFELQLSVRASEIACWFECMCVCGVRGAVTRAFFFTFICVWAACVCVRACVR